MRRILVFGNSGSGKTTMARALAREHGLAHLDLDALAWEAPARSTGGFAAGLRRAWRALRQRGDETPVRRPLADSVREIRAFIDRHPQWVVEGSYGDLIEATLPFATEVRFLNPGVEACVANCRTRPWEPEKYASREEQYRMLDFLIGWVRKYETRTDEYSLGRHRRIFDAFDGPKTEFTA